MNEGKKEALVGLTVIVGVIILVTGILWGKGGGIFSQKNIFKAEFVSAEGLKKGDNVVVRGVKCGRVQTVLLTPSGVTVEFWIRKNVHLYSDMILNIAGLEMMGGKALVIKPGKSKEPADPSIVYSGIAAPGIDKLFAQVSNVVEGTDSVLSKVSSLIEKGKIENSALAFNRAVNGLYLMISENRKNLKSTIDGLNEISSVLKEDSSAQRFSLLISRADSTMKLLQKAILIATTGRGSLARTMQDSILYFQFLKSIKSMDSLVTDLKNNPSKYIHVTIF